MATKNSPCENCKTLPRDKGLRFCTKCAASIRAEMVNSGYLEKQVRRRRAEKPAEPMSEADEFRAAWDEYSGCSEEPRDQDDEDDITKQIVVAF